jgi:hypothetical protein
MFTLYLKNDPAAAFPLATANWTIQRAPVDARLVLEATLGAKRAREVGKVVAWVKANRIGTTKSWAAPSRSEAEDRRHFRAPPQHRFGARRNGSARVRGSGPRSGDEAHRALRLRSTSYSSFTNICTRVCRPPEREPNHYWIHDRQRADGFRGPSPTRASLSSLEIPRSGPRGARDLAGGLLSYSTRS